VLSTSPIWRKRPWLRPRNTTATPPLHPPSFLHPELLSLLYFEGLPYLRCCAQAVRVKGSYVVGVPRHAPGRTMVIQKPPSAIPNPRVCSTFALRAVLALVAGALILSFDMRQLSQIVSPSTEEVRPQRQQQSPLAAALAPGRQFGPAANRVSARRTKVAWPNVAALPVCHHGNSSRCPAPHCMWDVRRACVRNPFYVGGRGVSSSILSFRRSVTEQRAAACTTAAGKGPPSCSHAASEGLKWSACGEAQSQPLRPAGTVVSERMDIVTVAGPFCVRESGPPVMLSNASSPRAPPLHDKLLMGGGLETGAAVFADGLDALWSWLQATTWNDTAAATCTQAALPALLFPVARKADNLMHALHRAVSAARYLRAVYGEDFRTKVVAVYVLLPEGVSDLLKGNAHLPFAPLVSAMWDVVDLTETASSSSQALRCYSSAHILRLSKFPAQLRPNELSQSYYRGWRPAAALFTWNGVRTAADFDSAVWFRQAMVATYNSENAEAPADLEPHETWPAAPKIVIVWRSRTRRMFAFDDLMVDIAVHARSLGAREVSVVEHVTMSINDVVRLHRDADILLGIIGAGLTWSLLMPPGAVVVEFSRAYGCSAGAIGWDKLPNCDYGGNAFAARQHHLVVPVPAYSATRRTDQPRESRGNASADAEAEHDTAQDGVYIPSAVWRHVLDAAVCKLRRPEDGCALPMRLGFDPSWDRERIALT
jgi:hypothetical protein